MSVAQWKAPLKSSPSTAPSATLSSGHNGLLLLTNAWMTTLRVPTVLAAMIHPMDGVVASESPGSVSTGSKRPSGPRVGLKVAPPSIAIAATSILSSSAFTSSTFPSAAVVAIARGPAREAIWALDPAALDADPEGTITFPAGAIGDLTLPRGRYLQNFVLANTQFHAATAYNILRNIGVPLGKADMMGATQLVAE